MLASFQQFFTKSLMIDPHAKIVLAVSGGLDSMVMLNLFMKLKLNFEVLHCNFQLRGAESERDMNFVIDYCKVNNLSLHTIRFETQEFASSHKISIQMAARQLRYEWFERKRLECGADFIATAHHSDDIAETFLINIIRGTGLAGLHGIPLKTNTIIRPLAYSSRKNIEEFANQNNIPWVEDSTNSSDKYLRNHIRHNILPLLIDLNANFLINLQATISKIVKVERVFLQHINQTLMPMLEINGEQIEIDIVQLSDIQDYDMYLEEFLKGYNFSESVIQDLVRNLNSDKSGIRFFSDTHRVIKDRQKIILTPLKRGDQISTENYWFIEADLVNNSPIQLSFNLVDKPSVLKTLSNTALIDYHKLIFPLIIRKWRPGDYFYPFGSEGKQLLSDFFINNKLSIVEKENVFILCSGAEIVWVINHRIDNRYGVNIHSEKVLEIKFHGNN